MSEYDSTMYLVGTFAKFPVLPRTNLRVAYDYTRRDFDDRRARSATGGLSVANPLLEYQYQTLSATALVGVARTATILVGLSLTQCDDLFAGYNDYTRQSVLLGAYWRPLQRLRIDLRAAYETYDYANAFAFDVPRGGPKEFDYLDASLAVQWRLTRHLFTTCLIRSPMRRGTNSVCAGAMCALGY